MHRDTAVDGRVRVEDVGGCVERTGCGSTLRRTAGRGQSRQALLECGPKLALDSVSLVDGAVAAAEQRAVQLVGQEILDEHHTAWADARIEVTEPVAKRDQ